MAKTINQLRFNASRQRDAKVIGRINILAKALGQKPHEMARRVMERGCREIASEKRIELPGDSQSAMAG